MSNRYISKSKTLIHHFLEESARAYPDKEALVQGNMRLTYQQLNSRVNQLAGWLVSMGVRPDDRVVLILPNGPEYVVSYYGILKAGAVAVPLSSDIQPDGLHPLLAELEPRVLISFHKAETRLQALHLADYGLKAILIVDSREEWPADVSIVGWNDVVKDVETGNYKLELEPTALASIIYTSGSTGQPKGVMLTHENIVDNTDSICEYLKLTEADIQMIVLPFHYVMGKSLLNTHFAVGGSVVINNAFAFTAAVIKQMVDEKVTAFSGVPSHFAHLLHRSPLAKYRDQLTALRYISQAGGHMSRQHKQELRQVLPEHTDIVIMYGATEASARLSYLPPDRFEEKIESIGIAIPGVTLKVLDPAGNELPNGERGEIVATGRNIMQGYWKDPQTTAKKLEGNVYHTGDMGYRDADGFFYVTGREDNLLKVGGHRINTQEVEDALLATGLAIEAVVIGVPDDLHGHKLVAVVTPENKALTESQILAKTADILPHYKVPSKLVLVRSVPKTNSGKINRGACVEIIRGS